jgi:molybdenum cofactor cytidylyltransferase
MRVSAVVLAAGESQRMGCNKLLLKIGGMTVLDRVLSAINSSRVDDIYVVLGARSEELKSVIESHQSKTVINPDYKNGMTSSFKSGLKRVTADAVFLCLGDQAVMNPILMNQMIDEMEADSEALIVSPFYEGRNGHPVLFNMILSKEIIRLELGETMRDIMIKYRDHHKKVEADFWCTVDIDTPEDYEKIRERLTSGS